MRNIGEKFALVKYDAKLCDYYAKHSKTLLAFREIKFYLRETFAKLRENKFTVTKKKYRREDRRKDVRTFRENYAKLRAIKLIACMRIRRPIETIVPQRIYIPALLRGCTISQPLLCPAQ